MQIVPGDNLRDEPDGVNGDGCPSLAIGAARRHPFSFTHFANFLFTTVLNVDEASHDARNVLSGSSETAPNTSPGFETGCHSVQHNNSGAIGWHNLE